MKSHCAGKPVFQQGAHNILRPFAAGAISLLTAAAAGAQTPSEFIGSWKVTWKGQTRSLEAALSITETGGTWKTLQVRDHTNNCVGAEHPIEFQTKGTRDAVVTMRGSQMLAGCPDFQVTMTLIDANNAVGKRGNAELTFVRR
jgi:hypothetical protein